MNYSIHNRKNFLEVLRRRQRAIVFVYTKTTINHYKFNYKFSDLAIMASYRDKSVQEDSLLDKKASKEKETRNYYSPFIAQISEKDKKHESSQPQQRSEGMTMREFYLQEMAKLQDSPESSTSSSSSNVIGGGGEGDSCSSSSSEEETFSPESPPHESPLPPPTPPSTPPPLPPESTQKTEPVSTDPVQSTSGEGGTGGDKICVRGVRLSLLLKYAEESRSGSGKQKKENVDPAIAALGPVLQKFFLETDLLVKMGRMVDLQTERDDVVCDISISGDNEMEMTFKRLSLMKQFPGYLPEKFDNVFGSQVDDGDYEVLLDLNSNPALKDSYDEFVEKAKSKEKVGQLFS